MSSREEVIALNTEFDHQRSERESLQLIKESSRDTKSPAKRKQPRRELVLTQNNEGRKIALTVERSGDSEYDTAMSRGLINRISSRVAVIQENAEHEN